MIKAIFLIIFCSISCLIANQRPNILYIFTDDQSHRSVSCYPEAHSWVETPNIDALAKNGVRFKSCYTGPWCQPSRAMMLTGRHPHSYKTLRIVNYPEATYDAEKDPFWPSNFRKHGYSTALIGKWHLGQDIGHGRDWDESVVWDRYPKSNSFKYYHGQLVRINGGERKPLGGYSTDRYTDFAVDYIKKEHKKPWFLWLCYGGVHGPFTPAERHLDDYSGVEHINVPEDIFGPRPTKPSFLKNLSRWKKGKQGEVLNFDSAVLKYHRAVKAIDEGVGRVIKALKASGQLENTLIVFTSDQGYAWGQHGFKEKWMPYDDNIKAPLIFSWKGSLPEGKVCDVPVNGLDITSTFHEIANIQEPWEMHGRSLATLIKNPQAKWNQGPMILENTIHAYGEDFTRQLKNREEPSRKGLYPWIMLRDQNYKYIRHISKNKIEELYDMNKDPKELNNLAVNPEYHILLKEMRHKTIEAFKAKGADFMDHAYDPLVKVIP